MDGQRETKISFWYNIENEIFKAYSIFKFIMQEVRKVSTFQCPSCDYKATKNSSMKTHMQSIHEGKTFQLLTKVTEGAEQTLCWHAH